MAEKKTLETIAAEIRYRVVEISHRTEGAHLAGALSCVDILTALYNYKMNIFPKEPKNADRDRLIFSKGHAVSALYVTLATAGYFPLTDLDHYNEEGSHLPEQPSPGCAPGVEWATGSLGHGLGIGIGMAMASRIQKKKFGVYVVMSDGECQEGSVWEAAMFAGKHKLSRLTAIVDFNKWQATGRSCDIMEMEPLHEKFRSFGWHAVEVNGHNINEICSALDTSIEEKPLAIIAHTIKGKGVSFMEDDNNWHYRSPNAEELKQAALELGIK